VPEVAAGRNDPFSAVANAPIVTRAAAPTTSPAIATLPTVTLNPPIATVPLALPQVNPAPADVSALPPVSVVPNPTAPSSLASTIEVSGIVQAGDRTSAIVRVPSEGTSRYVNEGDYLANGRILVKRIDVSADAEPVVILEQDGIEVIRTVGSGGALVGLL
jgi:hypothetical protein